MSDIFFVVEGSSYPVCDGPAQSRNEFPCVNHFTNNLDEPTSTVSTLKHQRTTSIASSSELDNVQHQVLPLQKTPEAVQSHLSQSTAAQVTYFIHAVTYNTEKSQQDSNVFYLTLFLS